MKVTTKFGGSWIDNQSCFHQTFVNIVSNEKVEKMKLVRLVKQLIHHRFEKISSNIKQKMGGEPYNNNIIFFWASH